MPSLTGFLSRVGLASGVSEGIQKLGRLWLGPADEPGEGSASQANKLQHEKLSIRQTVESSFVLAVAYMPVSACTATVTWRYTPIPKHTKHTFYTTPENVNEQKFK